MGVENIQSIKVRNQTTCRGAALHFAMLLLGISALCSLGWIVFSLYGLLEPPPPGFHDWGASSDWDAQNISRFVGVQIPADAINLQIEGSMGLTGSYGIIPRLQFSFEASPESATAFATAFCRGVLHPGYDPLQSIDIASPSPNSVLIHANRSLHYSYSPGISQAVEGNRCGRQDYVEEITLDRLDSARYRVSYRLPYKANGNPAEYYPFAESVSPAKDVFRLYVTGLRKPTGLTGETNYQLSYPTLCFITSALPLSYDWVVETHWMDKYVNSSVSLSIDGITQPPMRMHGESLEAIPSSESDSSWPYCISENWNAGIHHVQFWVTAQGGKAQPFSWDFEAAPS